MILALSGDLPKISIYEFFTLRPSGGKMIFPGHAENPFTFPHTGSPTLNVYCIAIDEFVSDKLITVLINFNPAKDIC